jgi:hypothetical protein
MDLTQQQKQQLLTNKGLNPSEWDIDGGLNIVQKTALVQPSVAPEQDYQQVPTDMIKGKTSAIGAFGASAAQGAIPAVASGIGFMGGMEAGATLGAMGGPLAPATVPIGGLLGGLVGAGLAGYGAGKIQQAVEPQAALDYVRQAQQEHPTASMLGGLADMPLAGMNPNPMNIIRAGGTAAKMIGNALPFGAEAGMAAPVARAEMANLMNVGQGAAISALQPNVEALVQGNELPSTQENLQNLATGALFNSPNKLGHAYTRLVGGTVPVEDTTIQDNQRAAKTKNKERELPNADEHVFDYNKRNAPEAQVKSYEAYQKKQAQYDLMNKEVEQQKNLEVANEDTTADELQNNLENTVRAQQNRSDETPDAATDAQRPFTALETETANKFKKAGYSNTDALFDRIKNWAKEVRGVTLTKGNPISDETGLPIAGAVRKGSREALISDTISGPETGGHEALHVFFDDMENSTNPKDKAIVQRYYNLIERNNEFKKINRTRKEQGRSAWTPNEFATTQQGMEFLRNTLDLKGETGFQKWKNDITSSLRTRFSKNATDADYTRLLNYRAIDEPYSPPGAKGNVAAGTAGEQRKQEDSQLEGFAAQLHDKVNAKAAQAMKGAPTDVKKGDIVEIENAKFPERRYKVVHARGPMLRNETEPYVRIEELEHPDGKNPESHGQTFDMPLSKLKLSDDKEFNLESESSPIQPRKIVTDGSWAKEGTPEREADKKEYSMLHEQALGHVKESAWDKYQNVAQQIENVKNKYAGMPPHTSDEELKKFIRPSPSNQSESTPFYDKEKEGRDMFLSGPKIVHDLRMADKPINKDQWGGILRNRLPKSELATYEKAGLDGFLGEGNKTPSEVSEWMKKNGDVIKTHVYGMEGKVSEAKKEYDKMTHEWYETLTIQRKNDLDEILDPTFGSNDPKSELTNKGWDKANVDKALRYGELSKQLLTNKQPDRGPQATSYYNTVSALDTTQPMPEWTTTKSGKNVQRVDVVIPHKAKPGESTKPPYGYEFTPDGYKEKGVLWQPDNLHENLPNTLGWAMIQYKTGPKGEKIAVIAEAQSRWGQSVREAKKHIENGTQAGRDRAINEAASNNHPLLRDYNRLILKAAIEQARKEGATHIMVSDAETAMMTEGHDSHADYPNEQVERVNEQHQPDRIGTPEHRQALKDIPKVVSQEPGMRLNYDTILPKIAEELTGSKGEKVSLGEHKNAMMQPDGDSGRGQVDWGKPRTNLIFKNADGTPKTDVSGTMYPLGKTPENFSMYEKRYSESSPIKEEMQRASEEAPVAENGGSANEHVTFDKKVIKGLTSALDNVRKTIPTVQGNNFADAAHQTFAERQRLTGFTNGIVKAARNLSKDQLSRVDEALQQSRVQGKDMSDTLITSRERNLFNEFRKYYQATLDERLKNNEPVMDRHGVPREAKQDPFYHANRMEPSVVDTLKQNTDTEAIEQYKKDFVENQTTQGVSEKQANASWQSLLDTTRGTPKSGDFSGSQLYFNANRKAQGLALPESMRDKHLLRNIVSYNRRFANDAAYYKHIESNDNVAASLGYKENAWGNKLKPSLTDTSSIAGNDTVGAIINEMKGDRFVKTGMVDKTVESLANAMMLGPKTEVHKIGSTIAQGFSAGSNPLQGATAIAHAITNLPKYWGIAEKTGGIVHDAKRASDFMDAHATAVTRISTLSNMIRKVYTLGDLTSNFNSAMAQGIGEYLLPAKMSAANGGDKTAIDFMKGIDPTWKEGKTYEGDDFHQLATEFKGLLHGTHDARTLPAWFLQDNEVTAFTKLMSWSMAQTQHFMKNIYTPATRGDVKPLMMSLLGTTIGGYALKELREELGGKKSAIPSLQEAAASSRGIEGNVPAVAYNLIAAMQVAGFAGILSQVARYPFDVKFKNQMQGTAFPLDEIITSTASIASNAAQAIATDPQADIAHIAGKASVAWAKANVQLANIALNHAANYGMLSNEQNQQKTLNDMLAQKRRFEMVEGLPFEAQGGGDANPFMNLEAKSFKKEQNMGEAAQKLQPLLQDYFQRWGNTPEILKEKLRSLKTNQYQTMPDPDSMPMSFVRYLSFLNKTEGSEVASERLHDYMIHKGMNQAKSSMVPSL